MDSLVREEYSHLVTDFPRLLQHAEVDSEGNFYPVFEYDSQSKKIVISPSLLLKYSNNILNFQTLQRVTNVLNPICEAVRRCFAISKESGYPGLAFTAFYVSPTILLTTSQCVESLLGTSIDLLMTPWVYAPCK
jgi:hypothetical protein